MKKTISTINESAETENTASNHQMCPACQEGRADELIAKRSQSPEAIARYMKNTGRMGQIMASLLLLLEVVGLFAVAKTTFGVGVFNPFCISVMFVAIITVLTKMVLSKASKAVRQKLFWGIAAAGCLLSSAGMIGFALLINKSFSMILLGDAINYGTGRIGNALLMLGLTLGMPLIIGALQDDASEKLYRAEVMIADIDERKRAVL